MRWNEARELQTNPWVKMSYTVSLTAASEMMLTGDFNGEMKIYSRRSLIRWMGFVCFYFYSSLLFLSPTQKLDNHKYREHWQ